VRILRTTPPKSAVVSVTSIPGVRSSAPKDYSFSVGVGSAAPAAQATTAQATAYLALSCDASATNGQHAAVAGASTPATPLTAPADGTAEALFNATALSAGQGYKLCADPDGATAAQAFGWTGVKVYVSGVTSVSPATMPPALEIVLTVMCVDGCSEKTRGFLARSCDTAAMDTEQAGGVQATATGSQPLRYSGDGRMGSGLQGSLQFFVCLS